MKSKKLFVLFSLAISILFTACTKEEPITNDKMSIFKTAQSLSDFYSFYETMKRASRTYYIQSYSGIHGNPSDRPLQIVGTHSGNNEPVSLVVDNDNISFSDYYFSQSNNHSTSVVNQSIPGFFGKNYDIKFESSELEVKSDGSINNPSSQAYIPDLFYPVSFTNLTTNDEITTGSKINWNKDINNTKGVVIGIEYHPNAQQDSLNSVNYPDYLLTGAVLEDDGEYTFIAADFTDFPDNADLTFYLSRVGYTSFEYQSSDTCTFAGVVLTGAGFTISIPN